MYYNLKALRQNLLNNIGLNKMARDLNIDSGNLSKINTQKAYMNLQLMCDIKKTYNLSWEQLGKFIIEN
jgi:hypothetical protein